MKQQVFVWCILFGQSFLIAGGRENLTIMGIFPHRGFLKIGQAMLVSAQIAIDQINRREAILPGYRLHVLSFDSECLEGPATKGFFESLFSKPTKIMVLGGGCPNVSRTIGQASHLWNLAQISYALKAPSLSNIKQYPTVFQIPTTQVYTNSLRIRLFEHFGWKRVAILQQSLNIFPQLCVDLEERLKDSNFTIVRSEIFFEDPAVQVNNLKKYDARIVVGMFEETAAMEVFCEAYKAGLYGSKAVWILTDSYDWEWWLDQENNSSCTMDQVASAFEGSFVLSAFYLHPQNKAALSGTTPREYEAEFMKRANGTEMLGERQSSLAYDAVWAIALALNATLNTLSASESPKRLENFGYEDEELGTLIYDSLKAVRFRGLKGWIAFDEKGDSTGMVKLQQIQGKKLHTVGLFDPEDGEEAAFQWTKETPIKWAGGKPPADAIFIRNERLTIPDYVSAIQLSLSLTGIILTIGFLAFNVVFRNSRYIKMSYPMLNNCLLVGCILGYTSIFLIGTNWVDDIFCPMNSFLAAFASSLTCGALFVKIWRVHMACTAAEASKTSTRDKYLYLFVMGLLAVDVVVIVLWEATDRQTFQKVAVPDAIINNGEILLKQYFYACLSTYKNYFLGILYIVKVIFVLFGAFLSWVTRKAIVPEVNDSKYIRLSIYSVLILLIIGLPVSMILRGNFYVGYALDCTFILFGITFTHCVIFLPKILVYREKKMDSSLEGVPDRSAQTAAAKVRSLHARKAERIQELENQLKTKTDKIEELRAQLLSRLSKEGSDRD